jgi:translation initiation factor 2D|eukprot:g7347.t1 g7347   contig24:412088-412765(-)
MAVNAKTEERRGTGFLTKTECRALIEQYIEDEELVDLNGKGRVLVNGPLCDALYRVSKKNKDINQQAEYPTSVKRKDLIEKWLARMEVGHAVVEMPGSTILHLGRGEPKPVDIEVEFRQGNKKKFLTRLRGMEEYGIDAEALSNDVSHRFACSSSVETNPLGRPALKKGRAELVFQGHLSEELTALLTGDDNLSTHGGAKGAEYNLPKSIVKVTLRKGVPARKRR